MRENIKTGNLIYARNEITRLTGEIAQLREWAVAGLQNEIEDKLGAYLCTMYELYNRPRIAIFEKGNTEKYAELELVCATIDDTANAVLIVKETNGLTAHDTLEIAYVANKWLSDNIGK